MILDDKTRHDLGWDALLALLAARCHTARGSAAALEVAPSDDAAWAAARAVEVSEAKALHDEGAPMLFGGIVELEPALGRAEKGGHLDGSALREVAATLAAGARLKRHLAARAERVPRLCGRALVVAELGSVSASIDDSFDDAGKLRDHASPSLGGLRRRAAVLHEELSARARALLDHPLVAPHLQDHFYTQREDRYVVPIRADARTRVKGIVHGTSGSGQTVFVEPEEIVDLNNRLKLAELEVLDEERRILGELTLLVGDAIGSIRINLAVLTELDLLDGAARLSIDLGGREALLTDGGRYDLRNARHPLMVLSGRACVPNDIAIERGGTLVISGPNAGGKTVALKTLGLLSVMAQCGLHLPAQEGSSLPRCKRVLTDVGDDQSLERNLSTFSAHVVNLTRFLSIADAETLVLLDEVAVGTDPEAGAALAQAVLEALAARGATVLVTTHYDRLKALAARAEAARFANASVGFDLARLEPTYRLHLGVPGASGAIVVARRLGLPEAVTARATQLAGAGPQGLDELLRAVDDERRRLTLAADAAEADRRAAVEEKARAEQLVADAKQKLSASRSGAHDEAVGALQRARVELDRLRAQMKKGAPSEKAASEVRKEIDRVAKEVRQHAPAAPEPEGRPATLEDLAVGAEVLVPRLGGRGIVTGAAKQGRVPVQVGALRMTVELADLLLPVRSAASQSKRDRREKGALSGFGSDGMRLDAMARAAEEMAAAEAAPQGAMRTVGNTCDLRGERVDAACAIAEKFIDDALRAGQEAVFFVHGHGTGALRAALRERLEESPAVAAVRAGDAGEGGDGVTVATLV